MMAASGSSECVNAKIILNTKKPLERIEGNLSGVKHALHGTSYQLKLGIVVCLANAEKSMNPANKFSFKVTAEDPDAGKFDDIVYEFQDGEKRGTLKIQAKHKLGLPAPIITLSEFTTSKHSSNPFAILKYFTSFCDQKHSITDMEGFIICTNSVLSANGANQLWKVVDQSDRYATTKSLDSYISTLFDGIGGKCYRLNYDAPMGSEFSKFQQLMRQYSQTSRLAKLLIKAIKSEKGKITQNSVSKDHHRAICYIIDKKNSAPYETYGFTKEFLDSSFRSSSPGYEAFRKEFEEQYRQEYHIDGSVWDHLNQKQVYFAKDFKFDEWDATDSLVSFPCGNVNESIQLFCDRFRLVCGTESQHGLDNAIVEILKNLHANDHLSTSGVEESMTMRIIFNTNFNWLMDPIAKPLHSEDIIKDLENINNKFFYIKMKSISDKLSKNLLRSPFRIRRDAFKAFQLYDNLETECIVEVETYDIEFCATFLLDILTVQGRSLACKLVLEELDFLGDSDAIKEVLRCMEEPLYLIIICIDAFKPVQGIIRKWGKDILNGSSKQAILIKKTNIKESDLNCFCINDITATQYEQFLGMKIPLCSTNISLAILFQNNLEGISIEEVIKMLKWGKHMETNNNIVKQYSKIESTYVQRSWTAETEMNRNAMKIGWFTYEQMGKTLKNIIMFQKGVKTFKELTDPLMWMIDNIFDARKNLMDLLNKLDDQYKPRTDDEPYHVLILEGEAGSGKSTNVTWLASYLQKRNPSSWVVRCNLSDHCFNFKRFMEYPGNQDEMLIDETKALRMLYELTHFSIVDMIEFELQFERLNARKCSECLTFADGKVIIDEAKMKHHGLSLNNSMQLRVFKEKFNSSELVLLMDGFDEIAPHYKQVVLQFLSHFQQFDGVNKMYLTSRPYNFKDQFKKAFNNPSFYHLKPLTIEDKGSILCKMMKAKWHDGDVIDKETFRFYKVLCATVVFSLQDLSDIPLNLMMSVDIIAQLANQYVNFPSKTFNTKLFEVMIESISQASFIVEKFVEIKVSMFFNKIGASLNAIDNPLQKDKYESDVEETKSRHGLVALWVFFGENTLNRILSKDEILEAKKYMQNIDEAREKSGIVNGIQDGVPMFIHRLFAEYLAAWWIIKRRINGQMCLYNIPFDIELRMEQIVSRNSPLYIAIVSSDLKLAKSVLSTNPKAFSQRDALNRTLLHVMAKVIRFSLEKWLSLLPKSFESDTINVRDNLLGKTALDYAFSVQNNPLIHYLLHHGATINANQLYWQAVMPLDTTFDVDDILLDAARYPKNVMEYLSRHGIEYKSHDAYKNIKQFCDRVAWHMMTGYANQSLPDTIQQEILDIIIINDSVWMLESIQQQNNYLGCNIILCHPTLYITETITKYFFYTARNDVPIFLLKYIFEIDPFFLNEYYLWKCTLVTVLRNYKHEFKWFFDHYCSRMNVKNFQVCSIHCEDDESNLLTPLEPNWSDYVQIVERYNENVMQNFSLDEIMIDQRLLSVLVLCLILGRLSMMRYLKESCKLNFNTNFVSYLAITDRLLSRANDRQEITIDQVYEYLLSEARTMSNSEANKMLRLAITLDLFEFCKALIERYNIDLNVVDALNGWNIIHLCVSKQRSGDSNVIVSMVKLFHFMCNKTDMNCFDIVDKKGRSILHLAIENEHANILESIVVRKLGVNNLDEIKNLSVEAIPNLTYCLRAIKKISKIFGEKECYCKVHYMLANQIAKISLTNDDESTQQSREGILLLQEGAEELYRTAVKCSSLFLMFYLHREFGCAIPPFIRDADWLACLAKSLQSPNLQLFQWTVGQYCISHHLTQHQDNTAKDICYDVFEIYDDDMIIRATFETFSYHTNLQSKFSAIDHFYRLNDPTKMRALVVTVEEWFKHAEVKLSSYRSKNEIWNMKLIAFVVSFRHLPALQWLCETFGVTIDQMLLMDLLEIEEKITNKHVRADSVFDQVYYYLCDRISNPNETDAEGRTIWHRILESGPLSIVYDLIKLNNIQTLAINEKNGWTVLHYFVVRDVADPFTHAHKTVLRFLLSKLLLNDDTIYISVKEMLKRSIKYLCFKSNDPTKSVVRVAIEAGNIKAVDIIIQLRFEIDEIDEYKITNEAEWDDYIECYDVVYEIVAQLPFNGESEKLLDKIARPLDRFALQAITDSTDLMSDEDGDDEDDNDEDDDDEEFFRKVLKYRLVATLERLIETTGHLNITHQINHVLASCSSKEVIACMMQCIKQNKTSLFRVLVGHYCTLQGITSNTNVEYDELKCNISLHFEHEEDKIDDYIKWSFVNEVAHDLSINQDYVPLLVLTLAYGRFAMTQYLIKMLQLEIKEPLVRLSKNILRRVWYWGVTKGRVILNQYQAGITEIYEDCSKEYNELFEYFIKHNFLDWSEIDSESGWNVGHYIVSEMERGYPELNLHEFQELRNLTNIDCFGHYDRNGRSVLHLAMQNGLDHFVEYLIEIRLDSKFTTDNNEAWDMVKIDECINELLKIQPTLPNNRNYQHMIQKLIDRKKYLIACRQFLAND